MLVLEMNKLSGENIRELVLPNEFACLHLSTRQDTEDDEDEEMAAGDEEDDEEDEDDEEGEGSPGSKFWYMSIFFQFKSLMES